MHLCLSDFELPLIREEGYLPVGVHVEVLRLNRHYYLPKYVSVNVESSSLLFYESLRKAPRLLAFPQDRLSHYRPFEPVELCICQLQSFQIAAEGVILEERLVDPRIEILTVKPSIDLFRIHLSERWCVESLGL